MFDDDEDGALIDEANLQIDGGNFFGGAAGASKKPSLKPAASQQPNSKLEAALQGQRDTSEYYNETESDGSRIRNSQMADSESDDGDLSFNRPRGGGQVALGLGGGGLRNL